jgi:hypothetical protein
MRNIWAREAGVGFTNVINARPDNNNFDNFCCSKKELPDDYPSLPPIGRGSAAYLKADYIPQLGRLGAELKLANPAVVVPVGGIATWAVLGGSDISNRRGTATLGSPNGVCPGRKVVPTFHPSSIIRGRHEWRPIVLSDLMKAIRESSTHELKRPKRTALINPELHEVAAWAWTFLSNNEALLAVDIETAGPLITCISFADSPQLAMTIPFRSKDGTKNYWPHLEDELRAWHWVRSLLECGRPLVFQNGMYDMQFLIRMGFNLQRAAHDTMLLHHSIYPESQKSLGFLGSIYTNEASWKLLGRTRHKKKAEKREE